MKKINLKKACEIVFDVNGTNLECEWEIDNNQIYFSIINNDKITILNESVGIKNIFTLKDLAKRIDEAIYRRIDTDLVDNIFREHYDSSLEMVADDLLENIKNSVEELKDLDHSIINAINDPETQDIWTTWIKAS